MTRTVRVEGAVTLLSSLSHGGDRAGTTSFLRREKICQPDGTIVEVPIVSGNSIRGILRDHAAHHMWDLLGRPRLPLPIFHLLWSGGALARAGSGHVLGARQLADVRRLVPHISLFGGSGAGKIIDGKLLVGKLVPVCAETAHIMPAALAREDHPSIWDMLQIEELTRRDDSKRDQLHGAIAGFEPAALTDGSLQEVAEHEPAVEDDRDGPAQQMRYGLETLAAGTRLHWWMALREVTDVEVALFRAAVTAWTRDGSHLGGRSATGHGRLRLELDGWSHGAPELTTGDALDLPGDPLAQHVAEHRDEIMSTLDLFA